MNHEQRIEELGARLERAVAADHRAEQEALAAHARRWRRGVGARRSRWFGGLAVTLAIAAPGAAWATGAFTSAKQEARGLPAAAVMFDSDRPSCTVAHRDVEYDCVLAHPPKAPPSLGLSTDQVMSIFDYPPNLPDGRRYMYRPGHPPRHPTPPPPGLQARWDRLRFAKDVRMLGRWGISPPKARWWLRQRFDAAEGRDGYAAGGVLAGQFKGLVVWTVSADRHYDGGCRSVDAAGTRWTCYLGEAAVRHRVMRRAVLGSPASAQPEKVFGD